MDIVETVTVENASSFDLTEMMRAAINGAYAEAWKTIDGREGVEAEFNKAVNDIAGKAFHRGRLYERSNVKTK